MSVYRGSGRAAAGRRLATVVALVAVGLLAGFLLGRATAPEPSATDVAKRLRTELAPVASGLSILPTEYPQAAEGREVEAVTGGLQRVRAALRASTADLRTLDPDDAQDLQQAVDALSAAVRRRADADEVARLTRAAEA